MPRTIVVDLSRCFECGKPRKHLHHVVPAVKGGTKVLPLCPDCHGKVHGTEMQHPSLIREGMRQARDDGRRYTAHPKYGYKYVDGRMYEDPVEQRVIRLVRTMKYAGKRATEIRDILSERGFKARNGRDFYIKLVWIIMSRV